MSKVCIECGEPLPSSVTKLYHERLFKKTKILKLVQCERCDAVCDKYLEYEGTLLLLDVGLQNKSALRHLLINEDHSSAILKVSLLTLIIDGYCRYVTRIFILLVLSNLRWMNIETKIKERAIDNGLRHH